MQRPTPTSGAPTSRRGSTESMYSLEGSPVLPFPKPANGKELPTTATCGPKCIEQFSKSDRAGSWQKTFSALLIGTKGWFSNRCTLTWKLRDTPYKRSYFQLAASTHRYSFLPESIFYQCKEFTFSANVYGFGTVTKTENDYAKDWTPSTSPITITKNDIN